MAQRLPGAPNWAQYAVAWPNALTWTASIEDAARVAQAQGSARFMVTRVEDGELVWPIVTRTRGQG